MSAALAEPGPCSDAAEGRALLAAGQPEMAFPLLLRALEAEPTEPAHWVAIHEALVGAGMLDAARHLMSQAVAIGLPEAALAAMREMLTASALRSVTEHAAPAPRAPIVEYAPPPAAVAGHLARGNKAAAQGRLAEAERAWRAALKLDPAQPEALNNLGGLLGKQKRIDEAAAVLRRCIVAHPALAAPRANLAHALVEARRFEEGEEACRGALAIDPAHHHANFLAGALAARRNEHAEAEQHYRAALSAKPHSAEVLTQLGRTLRSLKRESEAEAAFHAAIAYAPDLADAHVQLSHLYAEWGVPEQAEAWLLSALERSPGHAHLMNTLAILQLNTGRVEEAVATAEAAIARSPQDALLHNTRLFALLHAPHRTPAQVTEAHREFGRRIEAGRRPHVHRPDAAAAGRRPRIGFVSGDLRAHVVAGWVARLWEKLRELGVELTAYSNHADTDHVTARLKAAASSWRQIHDLPDDAVAALIRQDRTEVLIDLSGHTGHMRLPVFALRPAPVQAGYVGYPATSGMTRLDYYMVCGRVVPEGVCDEQFTEKLVRLPQAYMFDGLNDLPPVNELPALSRGHFTFGSFNRISKAGQHVVDLWARAMHAVPGSRFLIGGMRDQGMVALMTERFARAGIAAERLHFRPHSRDYLRFHHEVDLLLDTFPYTGGTTSSSALAMGVPVLTLAGETFVSRVTASLAGHVGVDGFVAWSADDYVSRAASWSRRLSDLAAIRRRLRGDFEERMGQCDLAARAFDAATRAMWRRHCLGEAPAPITIRASDLELKDRAS
jgi:predicted O-linked N-acetylglucosamine transferase (SPINDLY family)